jgi:hypothetical protein
MLPKPTSHKDYQHVKSFFFSELLILGLQHYSTNLGNSYREALVSRTVAPLYIKLATKCFQRTRKRAKYVGLFHVACGSQKMLDC